MKIAGDALVRPISGCERPESTGEDSYAVPTAGATIVIVQPAPIRSSTISTDPATSPGKANRCRAAATRWAELTVTAGVASIAGTYSGVCSLGDLQPHSSLLMPVDGSKASGTIGVDVQVTLADLGNDTTQLTCDADAVAGGMAGGLDQRMLTSVSKCMDGTFLGSINGVDAAARVTAMGAPAPASAEGAQSAGQTFVAQARTAGPRADKFLTGVVGAGLVLLGVVAGALAGRRRD